MKKSTPVFKAAFLASLPVLAGYTAMGCAFGILLGANAGLGAGWSLLMSLTILSGSMQFAAVDILNAGLPFYKVALLTFFINIRYAMYGFALIERFRGKGWKKLYMIFALTDETYALQVENKVPEGGDSTQYCFTLDRRVSARKHCGTLDDIQQKGDRLRHDRAVSGDPDGAVSGKTEPHSLSDRRRSHADLPHTVRGGTHADSRHASDADRISCAAAQAGL